MSSASPAEARYPAVIVADRETTITYWSDGAARLFGHSASDALGQSLDLIVPERLRLAHRKGFSAAMENPVFQETVLDIPALMADGHEREHPVKIVVLTDPFGVALGALAIFSSDGRVGTPH